MVGSFFYIRGQTKTKKQKKKLLTHNKNTSKCNLKTSGKSLKPLHLRFKQNTQFVKYTQQQQQNPSLTKKKQQLLLLTMVGLWLANTNFFYFCCQHTHKMLNVKNTNTIVIIIICTTITTTNIITTTTNTLPLSPPPNHHSTTASATCVLSLWKFVCVCLSSFFFFVSKQLTMSCHINNPITTTVDFNTSLYLVNFFTHVQTWKHHRLNCIFRWPGLKLMQRPFWPYTNMLLQIMIDLGSTCLYHRVKIMSLHAIVYEVNC